MTLRIGLYAAAVGAFMALLIGVWNHGHAAGYAAGVEDQRQETTRVAAQRDEAIAAGKAMVAALEETTAAAKVEAARAKAQQEVAEIAVRSARAAATDADRTLKAWMERYAEASRDPSCRILEEPLCAAAPDF